MITSKSNPRVQNIRSLLNHRKERDISERYVIEGVRLIEEAANRNIPVEEIYFSRSLSDRGQILITKFDQLGIKVEEISDSIFEQIMDTSTSQGIAAICKKTVSSLPDQIHFGIIADQIRDPGNLGTIIRVASAAGAQFVITTKGSVDLFSPKVMRSAMGAHFHTLCLEQEWDQILHTRDSSQIRPISYVATAEADLICWNCDFVQPTILIIGNEADGPTANSFNFADHHVSIPMPGNFESLNAAIAAGILIFEVVRQRTSSNK